MLTDCPNMTIVVYHGRQTTTQEQQLKTSLVFQSLSSGTVTQKSSKLTFLAEKMSQLFGKTMAVFFRTIHL